MGEWVGTADLDREARVRLFCLPHAGSGAAGFHRWKRMLPAWVAVCPLALPGREARIGERALASVEEIVSGVLGEVGPRLGERPYAIFGHSMGALLGFRWAQRIAEAALPTPVRVFCSGRNGPRFAGGSLAAVGDEELLTGLATRYGAEATAMLQDAEMRAIFLPGLRADLRVVEGYRFSGQGLPCGISAWAGAADGSVSDAGLRAWSEVSGPGFRSRRFPGGHFYTFGQGQEEMLGVLEEELEGF